MRHHGIQVIMIFIKAVELAADSGLHTQQPIGLEMRIESCIRPWSADCLLKTSEVTQMQIGETAREFKIIVSTVAEAEHHVDQLVKARNDGKNINVRIFSIGLIYLQ